MGITNINAHTLPKSYTIIVNGIFAKSVLGYYNVLKQAEKYTGNLFNKRIVEIVDNETGEIIKRLE